MSRQVAICMQESPLHDNPFDVEDVEDRYEKTDASHSVSMMMLETQGQWPPAELNILHESREHQEQEHKEDEREEEKEEEEEDDEEKEEEEQEEQQQLQSQGVSALRDSNPVCVDPTLVEKYDFLDVVGMGAHSTVYRAIHRKTQRVVAIKHVSVGEDQGGVPSEVLREVACLRTLDHPNIVGLLEIHSVDLHGCSLVFEFLETSLRDVLKLLQCNGEQMGESLIRRYSLDILRGVHACHLSCILHRDLKPLNLLVGQGGLKIGGFSSARFFSPHCDSCTLDIISLWYRAPELLLGCREYGPKVDMWSIGCIVAEMATGAPIFDGDSQIATLLKIFRLCGTPSETTWPDLANMDHWSTCFPQWPTTNLQSLAERRTELSQDLMEIICGLLVSYPVNRLSARGAKQMASQLLHDAPIAI